MSPTNRRNEEELMKTETKATHTPTPWSMGKDGMICTPDFHTLIACVGDENHISRDEHRANAAFIIHAVNSHEELLKHLKQLVASVNPQNHSDNNILEMCNEVISKVEGL